jgi:hypothetical protein
MPATAMAHAGKHLQGKHLMRIMPTRTLVAGSLAAVLIAGLAGCGGSNSKDDAAQDTSSNSTASAAPSDSASTAGALTPVSTGNPFADIRTAAMHMPETADALAGGIAKATNLDTTDTDAATLRAGLTYLLTEHVYLAGIAVATAYHAGATSDAFKAAAKSLDDNSVAVSDAVTKIVGDAQGKIFLAAWRSHVTDFVNYAVGAKTPGAAGTKMKDEAVTALKGYAKASGAFFDKNTKGALKASAVEKDTLTHINTLAAAVDDFAAGKTTAYAKLKTAADHMAMTADVLAGGIAKATDMKGSVDDKASALRSGLTGMLVSHVYLAGVAVFTAYTTPDSVKGTQFKAAADALDKNSVDLSDAVKSVSDKASADTFLQVWRTHITNFVDYAVGDATNDAAAKTKALADLDAYRSAAGQFFSKVTGGALPAAAVADALKMHIESLAGAIDSLKAALVTT